VPNSDEVAASLSEVPQAGTNRRQGLARELTLQRQIGPLHRRIDDECSWPRREMPSSAAQRSGEAVGGSEARRPTGGSPRSRAEGKSEFDLQRG
jgi:hypothetical protein